MNIRKTGIVCIFLGVLLYVAYLVFCGKEISAFGDFSSGILLGLSIATNLVGIVLAASSWRPQEALNTKKGGFAYTSYKSALFLYRVA